MKDNGAETYFPVEEWHFEINMQLELFDKLVDNVNVEMMDHFDATLVEIQKAVKNNAQKLFDAVFGKGAVLVCKLDSSDEDQT